MAGNGFSVGGGGTTGEGSVTAGARMTTKKPIPPSAPSSSSSSPSSSSSLSPPSGVGGEFDAVFVEGELGLRLEERGGAKALSVVVAVVDKGQVR